MPTLIDLIMFLVGLTGVVVFIITFPKSLRLKLKGVHVEGTITDVVANFPAGRGSLAPVVTFLDASGKTITFRAYVSGGSPIKGGPFLGTKVPVLYNANNSQDARINLFRYMWFKPLVSFIIAVAFLSVSLPRIF